MSEMQQAYVIGIIHGITITTLIMTFIYLVIKYGAQP